MIYVVRYIKQADIDNAERLTGKRLGAERIEAMKSQVRVESESGAQRLVDSLRMSGHIAAYYHESEL